MGLTSEQRERIEGEEYRFDSAPYEVVLRADARRHGLVCLRRRGSELNLVRQPYFSLNVYRFMSAGKLMAIARDEPFEVEVRPDGVTLRWQATVAHPARLTAEYAVRDEGTVDVTLTSEVEARLEGYEVYLSSYFDFALEPYAVLPSWPGRTGAGDQRLVKLVDSPLIHGNYLVFPRDSRAASQRFDGRWIDAKTGKLIAPWVSGPFYGRPAAVMARPGEYVVQMADPTSCIGIGTTYAGSLEDSIVRHNALYFSFFGEDVTPGARQVARMRQCVRAGEPTIEDVLALYDAFVGKSS